jgi:autophagy-related protein 2
LGDTLNDLWTPDVKANQLADVISGISPIRSVVNVGSGMADLVLLPIAQYRKDRRLVRGVQKGTTSFVKTTAMEAVKLGARLATGTQVILEQAEHVLGGGTAGLGRETMVTEVGEEVLVEAPSSNRSLDALGFMSSEDEEYGSDGGSESGRGGIPIVDRHRSKYAHQPGDVKEGMEAAYKSLGKNLNSAAQTILAVPMEVYERSGNEVSPPLFLYPHFF